MTQSIPIAPNVPGDTFYGDNVFKVNTNYGTIVYKQAAPPVQPVPAPPQPPKPPLDFVGRAGELIQLDGLIAARTSAVVFGPEGIGKSALVKQAANGESSRRLKNGVVCVEGVDEKGEALKLDDVVQQLFDQLFVSTPPRKVTAASARAFLNNTQPLVLLDNLSLTPDAIRSLAGLFPNSPLLVTGLRPLGDVGRPLKLGPLAHNEAVLLLGRRLGLGAETLPHSVHSVCKLLNDVPLAITTVAEAMIANDLAPESVQEPLAAIAPTTTDPIQAAIGRAYRFAQTLLADREKELLAIVAAAPGVSVDPDWVRAAGGESVTAGGEVWHRGDEVIIGGVPLAVRDGVRVDDPAARKTQPAGKAVPLSGVAKLEKMGLLRANSPRLRIAPGLRAAVLAGVDENALKERLLAQALQTIALKRADDWNYYAAELGNLLGLLEWATNQGRWSAVIALGRALDPYLTLHGLWDAWQTALERVRFAARQSNDPRVEAWALHQLGTREIGVGTREGAIALLRQALEMRRVLGDRAGMAYTQHNLDLLLPPPAPPREPEPKPPAKPGGGNRLFIGGIIGGVGLVGLTAFVVLGYFALQWLWPRPTPRPVEVPPGFPPPDVADTIGPDVFEQVSTPEPAIYGECDSRQTFSVGAGDPSGVAGVEIWFRYEGRGATQWFSVNAEPLGGDRFQAVIDNNQYNPYSVLGAEGGVLRWYVIARDKLGNSTQTKENAVKAQYCIG